MSTSTNIISAAVSDRGLSEKRPQNEDSFLQIDECGIYAVADGVGGAQAGEVASQMAVEILGEAFSNLAPGHDAEDAMRSAIEKANSAIYRMSQELPQLSSMATTVVVLHVKDGIATIGHVGDSRLYRVDRDGSIHRETDDHSVVAEEVRAGRLTEAQAENHPAKNVISRALGAEPTVNVDLKTIMIEPGTTFLLCSDGITRHVGDQEIKGVLAFGNDPAEICSYLKDLCYKRGAEDNLTAVVVRAGRAAPTMVPNAQERTIATARSTGSLDLDEEPTASLPRIRPEAEPIDPFAATIDEFADDEDIHETIENQPSESAAQPLVTPNDNETYTSVDDDTPPKRRLAKALGSSLLLLIAGAIVGIGVFYLIAPKPVDTRGPQLTQMRAQDIPLSTFEKNRRDVDHDPAGWIGRFGAAPQDAEDYYLLGRAYLLTGDYTHAQIALMEARNRLVDTDPTNQQVLATDIAMGLVMTTGTTVQTMFRNELNAVPAANANSNANSNSNATPNANLYSNSNSRSNAYSDTTNSASNLSFNAVP